MMLGESKKLNEEAGLAEKLRQMQEELLLKLGASGKIEEQDHQEVQEAQEALGDQ